MAFRRFSVALISIQAAGSSGRGEGRAVNSALDRRSDRYVNILAREPENRTLAPAAHQAMLEALVEVRKARRERLTLTAGTSEPMNWLAMVILGVLTQIAVVVVQLERVRPQALALFVFTTAFAATAVLVGLSNDPISKSDRAPFRAAVASAMP
jgi:hypothetical protein